MSKAKVVAWLWDLFAWATHLMNIAFLSGITSLGITLSTMAVTDKEQLNLTTVYNWHLVLETFLRGWLIAAAPLVLAYVKNSPVPALELKVKRMAAKTLPLFLFLVFVGCAYDMAIGKNGRGGHLRILYIPPDYTAPHEDAPVDDVEFAENAI